VPWRPIALSMPALSRSMGGWVAGGLDAGGVAVTARAALISWATLTGSPMAWIWAHQTGGVTAQRRSGLHHRPAAQDHRGGQRRAGRLAGHAALRPGSAPLSTPATTGIDYSGSGDTPRSTSSLSLAPSPTTRPWQARRCRRKPPPTGGGPRGRWGAQAARARRSHSSVVRCHRRR
jgi:hypothetical protein